MPRYRSYRHKKTAERFSSKLSSLIRLASGSARVGQDDLEDILRDALLLDDGPVVRIILVDVARLGSILLLEDVPGPAPRVVPELVDVRIRLVLDVVRVVDADIDVLCVWAVDRRGVDDVLLVDVLLIRRYIGRRSGRRHIDSRDCCDEHRQKAQLHDLHECSFFLVGGSRIPTLLVYKSGLQNTSSSVKKPLSQQMREEALTRLRRNSHSPDNQSLSMNTLSPLPASLALLELSFTMANT